MKKITVYIDVDNTIVDFSKQAVEKFNKLLSTNKNYEDLERFNFVDLFPELTEEIREKIFCNGFYINIEKYQNVDRVLMEINKKFNIVFVTKGNEKNLEAKEQWLKENLYSKIKYKFIGLPLNKSKAEIDMSNGIIIDDQIKCLNDSNAKMKILYADRGKPTEWNGYLENINAYVVESWQEILDILNFVREVGIYTND